MVMTKRGHLAITLAAATCLGGGLTAAGAQTPLGADAVAPAVSPTGAPATPPDAGVADTGPTTSNAASAPTSPAGPVVAFVEHSGTPFMTERTAGRVAVMAGLGGAIGGLAEGAVDISNGREIARNNAIEDPSSHMAQRLAAAYATSVGGRAGSDPLTGDGPGGSHAPFAEYARGANYVVDVSPVMLTLSYLSFDWGHYDLALGATARVIDARDGKVIAKAHCYAGIAHSSEYTHDDLLADRASGLKRLIAYKSDICVRKLETDLHLPATADPAPGETQADGVDPSAEGVHRF